MKRVELKFKQIQSSEMKWVETYRPEAVDMTHQPS